MAEHSKQALDWIVGVPRSGLVNLLTVSLFFTSVCFAWWLFAQKNEFLYSHPLLVFDYYGLKYERLLEGIFVSAQHVLISLVIGSLLGFPIGIGLALYRPLERASTAVLGFTLAYPKLAVMFVTLIWIGHIDLSIYVTHTWVTMLVHILMGFRATQVALKGSDATSRDTAHAAVIYHRTRRELFWRYVLPLVRSSWFLALMYSSSFLWPLLIFSEPTVSTSGRGLGVLVHNSIADGLHMDQLFAVSILIGCCNLATWGVLYTLERRTARFV